MTLRSVVDPNDPRRFAPWVRELDGASGVYRIVADGRVLYVGSSVNGNLYGTLTRKMQQWARRQSRASPGHTFDRFNVKADVEITSSDDARAMEQVWIERFRPELNEKAAALLEESYEAPRRSGDSDLLDDFVSVLDEPDEWIPF